MPVATIKPTQLKKQLRDTQRLLARPNLPADMRREQERKLAHISAMIVERVSAEKEVAMKKRFAKIRFFEGRKAERHLKTASRELLNENSEEKLAQWVEAKRDLIYVQAHPYDQKYISLWPSTPLTDAKFLAQRAEMTMNLSSQHDCDSVTMENAVAMAQSILDGSALAKKSVKVNQQKSNVQSLKDDQDEDDEDGSDYDSEEDEEAGSESGSEDDEDDEENSDYDSDDVDAGSSSGDDEDGDDGSDSGSDDEEEDSDSDDDDDEGSDSDSEDEEDESEESEDEEDDDDEEDESDSEDDQPSRKRRK